MENDVKRNISIGATGHVDHGKTTLTYAITSSCLFAVPEDISAIEWKRKETRQQRRKRERKAKKNHAN
tara:strand:- start:702 stop:905 length:204 start_codon:yes stop_codon:yes gene_type:complete